MTRLIVGSLMAALLCSTSAIAQQAPAPIWQGFYVGANLGGVTRHAELTSIPSGRVQESSQQSGAGGIFTGYSWQSGNLVTGVEGDYTQGSADTGSLLTLRARVGWAFNNMLLYSTVGVGSQGASVTRFATSEKVSHRLVGFVVGGGVETKIARNWGLRAEALYYDSGKQQFDFAAAGGFGPSAATLNVDKLMYRVGFSYQFN
jgi:outer membrane immunogenic protein